MINIVCFDKPNQQKLFGSNTLTMEVHLEKLYSDLNYSLHISSSLEK